MKKDPVVVEKTANKLRGKPCIREIKLCEHCGKKLIQLPIQDGMEITVNKKQ